MVAQEPVKAAIWHALNAYCFTDAIFLAERLYAEVRNEEVLHLLATCYHRAGHTSRTYNLLKKHSHININNKFLFATSCYILNKLSEAEVILVGNKSTTIVHSVATIKSDYGPIAGVTLQLLGNVYRKSGQTSKAVECYKQSLKCNPFLWSSFEHLCQIGEKIDPLDYFKTSSSSKIPQQQQPYPYSFSAPRPELSSLGSISSYDRSSSENMDPAKHAPLLTSTVISKPQQDLSSTNGSRNSIDIDMPPPPPVTRMNRGVGKARQRILGTQASDSPLTPNFGLLPVDSPVADLGSSPMFITPPVSNLAAISMKAPVKIPTRKTGIKKPDNTLTRQSSYSLSGIHSSSPALNRQSPANDVKDTSFTGLRRSSRLFGTNTSTLRDVKKTPKVHFALDGKSPTSTGRKTKSRINRSSISTHPLTPTTQNIIQTTTQQKQENTDDLLEKDVKPSIMLSPIQQSADGLMTLLKDIGKAYHLLTTYNCQKAIEVFESLPLHQMSTCWVLEKMAIAYFETGDMALAEKAFEKVRELDAYNMSEGLAIYSSLLWLARKESLLSSLAQDLVDHNKESPVAWCAMANCFSLQKEHDLAIKFLERAIQLDPEFTYAYSLLGHEYVYTEELDRALSCFRAALRYNERHYNAWYGIGMIHYKQEKYTLAEYHYRRALKINPNHSVLLCHLAVTQHDLGRIAEALETVSKASELAPKNALCRYHKARFLVSLDKAQEALEELNQLKKIVPKDSLVYFMIGKTYQKMDEPHLAQMNFSWAMNLDPQGTNTMIKEAMNQQRYVSDDFTNSLHTAEDTIMSDVEESS